MLSNDEFARLWRNNAEINPDDIMDTTLRSMYVEYLAHELDMDELYEKIERYVGGSTGKRLGVFGSRYEDAQEQSNGGGTGFPN